MTRTQFLSTIFSIAVVSQSLPAEGVAEAIKAIRDVSAEGKGNAVAAPAWKILVNANPKALPELLAAMDGANPLAKNWLQSAILAVGEKPADQLPQDALTSFLENRKHDQLARRLAYELLVKADPGTPERLLPGLLNDPSPLLRRDSVQRLMDRAAAELKDGKKDVALKEYQEALSGALEEDQVRTIADALKDLGQKPNLIKHFGFLTQWKIIGPFHNTGRKGFNEEFSPEKELQFAAGYPGKEAEVKWKDAKVTDELGMVDFNKEYGMLKEVTAYAATTFVSDVEGPAQLRLGTRDGWKVWLNGEFIFGRDEYHRGGRIDQYKMPVILKKGPNVLLVKCCQNEETETWTTDWRFQIRFSDENGKAIQNQQSN